MRIVRFIVFSMIVVILFLCRLVLMDISVCMSMMFVGKV